MVILERQSSWVLSQLDNVAHNVREGGSATHPHAAGLDSFRAAMYVSGSTLLRPGHQAVCERGSDWAGGGDKFLHLCAR